MKLTVAPYDLAAVLLVARNVVNTDKIAYKALTGHEWDADGFAAQTTAYYGPAWVAVDDQNNPHAAGGFIQQRPGVFRSWFISDRECWQEGRAAITALARQMVAKMVHEPDVHLIETWTLASNVKARAWYGRIGLSHEATLHEYGASREDVVIYVARKGGLL